MIGERVKILRDEVHLSQAALGEILGLGKSAIGMIENDNRLPSIETLIKLAKYFNVTTDFLLGIENLENDNEAVSKIVLKGRNYSMENNKKYFIPTSTNYLFSSNDELLLTKYNNLIDEYNKLNDKYEDLKSHISSILKIIED